MGICLWVRACVFAVCGSGTIYFFYKGNELWIAEYDLESTKEDELTLKRGDILHIVEKSDSGWWKGRANDGETGWLPASYLRAPTAKELQEKKEVYKTVTMFLSYFTNVYKIQAYIMLTVVSNLIVIYIEKGVCPIW